MIILINTNNNMPKKNIKTLFKIGILNNKCKKART